MAPTGTQKLKGTGRNVQPFSKRALPVAPPKGQNGVQRERRHLPFILQAKPMLLFLMT